MSAKSRRPGNARAGDIKPDDKFLAWYYAHVPTEELKGYSSDILRARAAHHLDLASWRMPGQTLVNISNELDVSIVSVVAEEMPYLLNSIRAELTLEDASVRLLVHPTFEVVRDSHTNGLLEVIPGPPREGLLDLPMPHGIRETWVTAEIGRLADAAAMKDLTDRLHTVLEDVRMVADDAAAIHRKFAEAVASVEESSIAVVPAREQYRQLLLWLKAGNFVLLGYTEYELTTAGGKQLLTERGGSSLGLLRRPGLDEVTPERGPALHGGHQILTIVGSGARSTVLRAAFLDEVRLQALNESGKVIGERRFAGLFTPAADQQSVQRIPIIRDKVQAVVERLGFRPPSPQIGKVLAILESFPRDELFRLEADELAVPAAEILRSEVLQAMRVLPWPRSSEQFVSSLVLLPRHHYTTAVRLRMEQNLKQAIRAKSVHVTVMPARSPVVCVLFRVHVNAPALEATASGATVVDFSELERHLTSGVRSWKEMLGNAIRDHFPPVKAARLSERWLDAFPLSYSAVYGTDIAVKDIIAFETLHVGGTGGGPVGDPLLKVYRATASASLKQQEDARIRLYLTAPRSLTQILPLLHNLGVEVLEERPFELFHGSGQSVYLYDLRVKYPMGADPDARSGLLADAFAAAMRGDAESDQIDALVIGQGVDWRQATILRSYAKYLQQLGTTNSYGFIADTLVGNPRATHALLALFHAKFDPGLDDSRRFRNVAAARKELQAAIDEVPGLDADRLLRTFMDLVEATLRTNYFLNKPQLSVKLDPTVISHAPVPRPKYEIWVYSPRLEGVHLRFGDLARGGLRWSDRSEDFRTEILGLVKAQEVKNSVIVPAGAKGGFYPKRLTDPASDRQSWLEEGLECYRIFIRGLLDLTDNLVITSRGEKVVPPQGVVRHDSDDYYLVVAADKGTASFSDAANAVAQEYGFWLGDAFASGGSVGYDHKQMGITARGAWESVKHHFNELGMDPQRSDFTAVGIGDMSGDVFGNAMLLSPHIRLLAAFDHRHIFLDPSPDAGASFEERQRLFRLPRSSWADYKPSLISPGGGVHSRSAKAIGITEEVRTSLGLAPGTAQLPPHVLIQAILRAPVDLLYNGGIGTYVKAAIESHAEVGDKANDALRVNGTELRARIVAEGGNLGITQRGRIDAALAGVLLNTDAIDNSAGVDCSDHEVNIKIFVDRVIASGRLPTAERAGLLQSLTNEVARLVLENNVNQNILLFNDRHLVVELSPGFERMMDWLEDVAEVDRNLEGLPSTEELHERLRAGIGLTSPELSVLAAHAKIELAKDLIASDLADDPWFRRVLRDYFPRQLSERFEEALDEHPLRRQIICTVLANDMVNLGGITFAFRVIEETNATAAAVARAFVVVREVYNLPWITRRLAALPADFPGEYAAEVALYLRRALDRATRWYVTHEHRDQPVTVALGRIAPTFELLLTRTREFLRGSDRDHTEDRIARWNDVGMPRELVKRASDLLESFGLLDISLLAERVEEPPAMIADLYYAVFHRIGALGLLLRITDLPRQNRWEASARAALRDDVYSAVADMTLSVLQTTPGAKGVAAMERLVEWESGHQEQLRRIKDTFAEVTKPGQVDIDSISVALKLLRTLVRR
ncbi:NAD-glutamate dehydrogenase [Paenarthrobacter sp. NPDC089322]|uniref:NAD-glutamate dehydrogenase n=1 Tax=Paenarthrobacter sp. NPDC089322 TaxID=3155065 RepID=UPI003425FBA1